MVSLASELDDFQAPVPAEASSAQIYISAAHSDRDMAERIATALIALGYEVVWKRDLGSPKSMALAAAHHAPCVLALASRASQTSKWVIEDAEMALARDALIVARLEPVMNTLMPMTASEPVNLVGWNGEQDDHDGWRTLLARIELIAGPTSQRASSGATVMVANLVGLVTLGVIFSMFAGVSLRPDRADTADVNAIMPAPTARGGPEVPASEPASAPKGVRAHEASGPALSPASLSATIRIPETPAPAVLSAAATVAPAMTSAEPVAPQATPSVVAVATSAAPARDPAPSDAPSDPQPVPGAER